MKPRIRSAARCPTTQALFSKTGANSSPSSRAGSLLWRLETGVGDKRGLTEVGREMVKRMAGVEEANPDCGLNAIWNTMVQANEWSGGEWQHVGIGTDFDGFTDPPNDCHSAAELPKVREVLERKGLSRGDIELILGGIARRVLRNGWR